MPAIPPWNTTVSEYFKSMNARVALLLFFAFSSARSTGSHLAAVGGYDRYKDLRTGGYSFRCLFHRLQYPASNAP